MNNPSLRAVFDNNVLISAALVGGVPRKALDKLLDHGTVLISVPVLLELRSTKPSLPAATPRTTNSLNWR